MKSSPFNILRPSGKKPSELYKTMRLPRGEQEREKRVGGKGEKRRETKEGNGRENPKKGSRERERGKGGG